jgi:hypothetical protein
VESRCERYFQLPIPNCSATQRRLIVVSRRKRRAIASLAASPQRRQRKVGLRGFDNQMKMVPHQAIGMQLPSGLVAGFGKCLQEARDGIR